MLAITISCPRSRPPHTRWLSGTDFRPMAPRATGTLFGLCFLLTATTALAQTPATEAEARRLFQTAQTRFQQARTNETFGWTLGQAAFDLAEFVTDRSRRLEVIQAGLDACRSILASHPDSAAAHFYLGLNLGQLAQTKKLSALRLVGEMEEELLKAHQLDPGFRHAAPARSLGILYLEAPPWPASIGNRAKARSYLQTAVRLAPEFPENHIPLAEAYAKWGEGHALDRQLTSLQEILPQARLRFPPDQWPVEWKNWLARLEKLEKTRDRLLAHPRMSPSERGARSPR